MQLSLSTSNPLCFIVHPCLTKHFFLLIFSHSLWLTSPSTLEQNFLTFSSPFLSWLSALGSLLSSSEWHPVSRLHEYLANNSSHWFHGVLILLDYSWFKDFRLLDQHPAQSRVGYDVISGCSGLYPDASWLCKDKHYTTSLGNLFQYLTVLSGKSVSLHAVRTFPTLYCLLRFP